MHDPMTIAHEIKWPFARKTGLGNYRYKRSIVTVWHVDPLNFKGKCGCRRDDDSCGWFTPSYSLSDKESIQRLAGSEYGTIWGRQEATQEGRSYAYVCFEPSCYDAIYWTWRAIKFSHRKNGWKFGEGRSVLSDAELQEIYQLSSNPIDNLRMRFSEVKNKESCESWFLLIYGLFLRHHRPWYKHPRWHINHWKIQFHPYEAVKRRFWDKCCRCGKRGFKPEHGGACGSWSGTDIWHSSCDRAGVQTACKANTEAV